MKRMTNTERIEGRVYQHNLALKTVQNQTSVNYGKEFISGTLDVATDEEGLNVLTVHFTYVTAFTKNGAKNPTYATLLSIINNGKTWVEHGKDEATKVRISTNLGLNDFYTQNDEFVSSKTNEGGFVTVVSSLSDESERNTFSMDMFITNAVRIDADPEKGIDKPYVNIQGAVFNFRNDLLPVDFIVESEGGMKYFENAGISNANPLFTKVWGKIVSATSVVERSDESAFGEAAVRTFERKTKKWIITGAAKIPYDFGDENILTANDIQTALQNREVYLADIKRRNDEYRANQTQTAAQAFTSGAAMNTPTNDIPNAATKATFNF